MRGILRKLVDRVRAFLDSDEYDRRVQDALQTLPEREVEPSWLSELTPPHERARIQEEGRKLARERYHLSAEVRVIARQYGVDF